MYSKDKEYVPFPAECECIVHVRADYEILYARGGWGCHFETLSGTRNCPFMSVVRLCLVLCFEIPVYIGLVCPRSPLPSFLLCASGFSSLQGLEDTSSWAGQEGLPRTEWADPRISSKCHPVTESPTERITFSPVHHSGKDQGEAAPCSEAH